MQPIMDRFTLAVTTGIIGCVFVVAGITWIISAVRGFRKRSASNYGVGDYIEYLRQTKQPLVLFIFGLVLFFVSISFLLLS